MSYLCNRQGNSARKGDIEGQGQVLKNGGGDSVKEKKTLKAYILDILDPREKFLKRWRVGFVLSCMIAVAMDPLFFYLPVINQKKKCVGFDGRLWKTTLVLRSFFDIIHLLHIILQFRTGFIDEELRKLAKLELNTDAWKIARKYLWPRFILDILTILPIPQVVVRIIISEMKGTESTHKVKFLNAVVLFQYVPRVYQIYLSWRKLITNDKKFDRILRVKAPLNFILYILAGHVLGAFWYFFSIQRLAACWQRKGACDQNRTGCYGTSFYCDRSSGDLSFINDICRKYVLNTTSAFDFGIFLPALQSGVLESPDFPQKLFFSFWWGMRNLSSLGGNLQTSNYIWENCFALSISIFGLILFLYFLGNLQMYMQWTTSKSIKEWDELRMKMKSSQRQKQHKSMIKWITKKDFDSTTESKIMDYINKRYEEGEDVNVENLIPDLPLELQKEVKRHICLNLLKNLKIIKDNGLDKRTQLLHKICDSLQPKFYNDHCYIVKEGDPNDAVFLITKGIVWTYTSNNGEGSDSRHVERLEKGQYFGGKLLEWVLKPTDDDMRNLSILPVSSKTLKTHKKVEAFALMAHDFKKILESKFSLLGHEKLQSKAAIRVQRIWRQRRPKTDDDVVQDRAASL
ncbi:cyclic nucleotide-gated ion channel 1-like isoform X2 [Quercus lobata]|uniref:cyclic nucleotide-gated ion channel 1-like isoform X2 n=1 Tax=Quercus lobata TaxID=97700 RepID=UPI0012447AAD|nr:cyclic nucleotide-gated ion channel 1-like isoform X2 [Quercus lobata]